MAHPARMPGGNSPHQCKIGNGFTHHRTSTYKSEAADFDTAYDGAVGAKCGTIADFGGFEFIFARNVGAGIDHIGEHHGRATKNVIAQFDQIVNGNIVLNPAALADFDFGADINILSERAVFTDRDFIAANMSEMPNFCTGSDFGAGIDYGCRMNRLHL